jgi:hypothetical protein
MSNPAMDKCRQNLSSFEHKTKSDIITAITCFHTSYISSTLTVFFIVMWLRTKVHYNFSQLCLYDYQYYITSAAVPWHINSTQICLLEYSPLIKCSHSEGLLTCSCNDIKCIQVWGTHVTHSRDEDEDAGKSNNPLSLHLPSVDVTQGPF